MFFSEPLAGIGRPTCFGQLYRQCRRGRRHHLEGGIADCRRI